MWLNLFACIWKAVLKAWYIRNIRKLQMAIGTVAFSLAITVDSAM